MGELVVSGEAETEGDEAGDAPGETGSARVAVDVGEARGVTGASAGVS